MGPGFVGRSQEIWRDPVRSHRYLLESEEALGYLSIFGRSQRTTNGLEELLEGVQEP